MTVVGALSSAGTLDITFHGIAPPPACDGLPLVLQLAVGTQSHSILMLAAGL